MQLKKSKFTFSSIYFQFTSPCYHPNVDTSGNICLDILKDEWSALYDVRAILLSIQSLLGGMNYFYVFFCHNLVLLRIKK